MKKRHGFTLIEVLVALAVFSVAAMAVLNATGQTLNSLSALEQKTMASIVAENQLAMLKLGGVPTAERSGTESMAGQTWYWTVKPVATSVGFLRAIDLIVWMDEKKQSPLVSVRTYVAAN